MEINLPNILEHISTENDPTKRHFYESQLEKFSIFILRFY